MQTKLNLSELAFLARVANARRLSNDDYMLANKLASRGWCVVASKNGGKDVSVTLSKKAERVVDTPCCELVLIG